MVEKLMDLSKKLQKQTASLAEKSTRKVRGTLGRQSSKLENAISGQVQKMNSLSKKIQRKSNNKKKTGKKQNTGKQNTGKQNTVKNNNNMSFNDHKCELCMQHCTSNGKVKKNNTMKNTKNNKVNKNSPVERVSRMIIKNQSQRMTKRRKINSN